MLVVWPEATQSWSLQALWRGYCRPPKRTCANTCLPGLLLPEPLSFLQATFDPPSTVQFTSIIKLCPTPCDPHGLQQARLPCTSPTPSVCSNSYVHQVSDAIQLSHPLSCSSPVPSVFPSLRVFSNESVLCIRWPKHWSFSFSMSPSNEHSGLTSLRTDWLDLLAIQGTLKSFLQHHSSKASILWCSAFFIIQL